MIRGDVVEGHLGRYFLVVSSNHLTNVLIVAEVSAGTPPPHVTLLAVPLGKEDPVSGYVRVDRLNYMSPSRLAGIAGRISSATMERVDLSLRAVLDLT